MAATVKAPRYESGSSHLAVGGAYSACERFAGNQPSSCALKNDQRGSPISLSKFQKVQPADVSYA